MRKLCKSLSALKQLRIWKIFILLMIQFFTIKWIKFYARNYLKLRFVDKIEQILAYIFFTENKYWFLGKLGDFTFFLQRGGSGGGALASPL